MPNRKVKRSVINSRVRRNSNSSSQVNFTFFNSKMFVILVAVALIVIVFAIFSSANNPTPKVEMTGGQYRIDTTNIQSDPSAKNVVNP